MKHYASANTMTSDACAPFSFTAKKTLILCAMVAAIAFLFVSVLVLRSLVLSLLALVLMSVLPSSIRGKEKTQTSI